MEERKLNILLIFALGAALLAIFKPYIDWVWIQDNLNAFMASLGGALTFLWTGYQEWRHRANHGSHLPSLKPSPIEKK